MDVPLLRTLTRKSKLGFGSFRDLTVQEVLDLKNTRYLRNCYYNLSKINFTEDILKEIRVHDRFRIQKPGTDKEMGQRANDYNFAVLNQHDGQLAAKVVRVKNKEKKRLYAGFVYRDKYRHTKANMQRINHGH